ncbi:hypothetical protein ACFWIA_27525 [Streptomyces sp. NPDC127068]|uniref:hypothetical protein n=1 Tax=Streptomyces sp. NPDC127068 TaxID=3347127 RepID=UPI00365DF682
MSIRLTRLASGALTALLVTGLTTGCNPLESKPKGEKAPDAPTLTEPKLPEDTDAAGSKKAAAEFRTWIKANGDDQQKAAASRVQRVLGDWQGELAEAYISTDINGGKTEVADPLGAAKALAGAFDRWKNAANGVEGAVSVHDVNGNALTLGSF